MAAHWWKWNKGLKAASNLTKRLFNDLHTHISSDLIQLRERRKEENLIKRSQLRKSLRIKMELSWDLKKKYDLIKYFLWIFRLIIFQSTFYVLYPNFKRNFQYSLMPNIIKFSYTERESKSVRDGKLLTCASEILKIFHLIWSFLFAASSFFCRQLLLTWILPFLYSLLLLHCALILCVCVGFVHSYSEPFDA